MLKRDFNKAVFLYPANFQQQKTQSLWPQVTESVHSFFYKNLAAINSFSFLRPKCS